MGTVWRVSQAGRGRGRGGEGREGRGGHPGTGSGARKIWVGMEEARWGGGCTDPPFSPARKPEIPAQPLPCTLIYSKVSAPAGCSGERDTPRGIRGIQGIRGIHPSPSLSDQRHQPWGSGGLGAPGGAGSGRGGSNSVSPAPCATPLLGVTLL